MPKISYWKKGKGQALVLLPGFCETKEMWEDFVGPLLTSCEVWCPDLPGFGSSDAYKSDFTISDIGKKIALWMLTNNIGNASLIGHSLGGYLALEMAKLPNLNLRGLGLFHSTAYPDSEEKKVNREKTEEFVNKHGVSKFISSSLPLLFKRENRDRCKEDIDQLIAHAIQLPKDSIVKYLKAMRDRNDNRETFAAFPKPKLMICGVEDTAVTLDDSLTHKKFVDQFCQLSDCGHMGMFEQKEKAQAAICDFMESLKT
ncbi:alpha/beta fold hydrolase [Cyclobacterium marinum]|uniref:Alpha/beta hydrolase fold containing protein n=1 Tax=Cyclobacterium marinum (strain ATCC 25205 / DSM 745 / LMG 13164 / NCIMB 1802) TaxID=880070 RepID=G0J5W8_CYCMS|nr:alpha/beta hydrolase [Cyclobacterium marinum]AEL25419.1 alpha/beta hydrolase fold containing protein [Cyclobacterium marinum DSM 745]